MSTNQRCCVIIPIYKERLENFEILSLHRLYQVLGHKYDIKFLTYLELNTQQYADIAFIYGYKWIDRIHFGKGYFVNGCGTLGYNFLMSNPKLYEQLFDYEYILVYHLDCYIFRDDLEQWMDVGEPHVECIIDNNLHYGDDIQGFWYNGEGLRNVRAFYDYITNNQEEIKKLHLVATYDNVLGPVYGSDLFEYEGWLAEDAFFTTKLEKTGHKLYRNFGWSNLYKEKLEEFGKLPVMLHWFNKYKDWSFEYIGNWETDLEECINNPKFINMGIL